MDDNNHIYVIFGASGDLTKRKLLPAIYALFVQGLLPDGFLLLGVSRTEYSDEQFRNNIRSALNEFKEIEDASKIDEFLKKIFYSSISYDQPDSYRTLKGRIAQLREVHNISGNTIFYLSTPPSLYGIIPQILAEVGLNIQDDGWKRVIIEKPFGYDLPSAIKLKTDLFKDWEEGQIYIIDHYLGKETVQNLLVTRFSNGVFEPLWNRNYVHHVEITSAESIGVEKRGGYYESSGALRDMVQNHLLQVVGLTAMEAPSSLESYAIRNEILKVFQSLRPMKIEDVKTNAVRGQYIAAQIRGEDVKGYRDEEGVSPDSTTETYAALKFYIDNWRWGGVPFYIRTGKRMPTRITEVVIYFKPTPHFLFAKSAVCQSSNKLIIRIQPDEGILLKFGMKTPGVGFEVQPANMYFRYANFPDQRIPSAYERLLHDTMKGDSPLFARTEEVMEAWKFLTPVLECWENEIECPLFTYPAGTWGPIHANTLIDGHNRSWRYPCKDLSDDGTYCEL